MYSGLVLSRNSLFRSTRTDVPFVAKILSNVASVTIVPEIL